MTIYVVTNRRTVGNQIKSDGKERALPTFRVGQCNPNLKTVTLFPDLVTGGYTETRNLQRGSGKLFFDLQEALRKADAENRREDVLVFVHGYNYSYEDSLEHIGQLQQRFMGAASPIKHLVYFSWPTRGGLIGLDSYSDDQRDAHETGIAMSRLFLRLVEFMRTRNGDGNRRCGQRVHLMAHSMGNQVLEFLLRALPERLMFQLFSEVFLLHADVDWTVFELGQPFRSLSKLAARTHIYINREDNALVKSHSLLNPQQRLGYRGPSNPRDLPAETFVVDTTKVPISGGVDPIDKLKERVIDHWGYLYKKRMHVDILAVVQGKDEDDIEHREQIAKFTSWFELQA